MSSSWLREFTLEGLGFEIRKGFPRDDEGMATTTAMGMGTTTGQARLVQILDRGQGGRLESVTNSYTRDNKSRNINTTGGAPGNDWWNVNRRGKSPNLAKHTNAWVLVSDGSHSARIYLTIEALREIFDWDEQNNNEDDLFGRGCCVLLKKYFFECDDVDDNNNTSISENEENANDHRHSMRYSLRHQRYSNSVQLKVSSLEPKPGFNHHHRATTNHANHNDNNSKAIIRPVMEEIDVLYGLQFLAQQRQQQQQQQQLQQQQQQQRNSSSGSNNDIHNSTMNNADIARDWDVAFGHLSKGRLTMTTTMDGEAEAVVDRSKGLYNILELAEKSSSTDEAIRGWKMAKKEYGITTTDYAADAMNNTISSIHKIQKPMATMTKKPTDKQDGDHKDNDQDNEDLSRMYIQNILATQDDEEEESENEKALTTQKDDEDDDDSDNDENLSFDDEGSLLPETQPKITLTMQSTGKPTIPSMTIGMDVATGTETRGETKTIASKSKKANDGDDCENFTQPAYNEEKESAKNIVETTTKMRYKRPRMNSFESGTASNLTLDEAITGLGSARKSTNRMRRRQQQQQLLLYQQQERSHNNTGIWESIKEQLFEPGRTVLYCDPSCHMPSGSDSNGEEKMLVTPKRLSTSANSKIKNFGSAASIGTNYTSSTPNPSSGAYYKKYGLARWLSQNTIDEERG